MGGLFVPLALHRLALQAARPPAPAPKKANTATVATTAMAIKSSAGDLNPANTATKENGNGSSKEEAHQSHREEAS